MADLSTARASQEELIAELTAAGAKFKGKVCSCPFHEDKHPSASVFQKDGAWHFRCFVCDLTLDIFDVRARRTGKPLADVLKELDPIDDKQTDPPKRIFPTIEAIIQSVSHIGRVEEVYKYSNPTTKAVEVAQVRWIPADEESKKFMTYRAAEGGFVLGAPEKPWPLYNRSRIAAAQTVVVVEGEKCVHALHAAGIVATCSLSGAKNASHADWSPLAGKTVYIWPDKDEPGADYARDVIANLERLDPRPTIWLLNVDPLELPIGGDVADFLQSGTPDEVWMILQDGSEIVGSGRELDARIAELGSGKWMSLLWPFPTVSRLAKSLFPGTTTMLCGDPGSGKSFLLLQAMFWWHLQGLRVSLYELEDDRAFHLHRLLAVAAESFDLLDDVWCKSHQAELSTIHGQYAEKIEGFSPRLYSAPVGELRYAELLEWIDAECKSGSQIIAVDPITAVSTGESRQNDDLKFIIKASLILRQYRARMILVTHPRVSGPKAGKTMDDLAGGRAFSRNTQTILWLHKHSPAKKYNCALSAGCLWVECNRSITISKSRCGPGEGWRVGFVQGHNVQFADQGAVIGTEDD